MGDAETLQRNVLNRIVLRAGKSYGFFEHRNFDHSRSQIGPLLRIVVEDVSRSVEKPFSRRIQLLKNVLDEEPGFLIENCRVLAPFGSDLLATLPKPDRVRGNALDFPLQIPPVRGLVDMNYSVLQI